MNYLMVATNRGIVEAVREAAVQHLDAIDIVRAAPAATARVLVAPEQGRCVRQAPRVAPARVQRVDRDAARIRAVAGIVRVAPIVLRPIVGHQSGQSRWLRDARIERQAFGHVAQLVLAAVLAVLRRGRCLLQDRVELHRRQAVVQMETAALAVYTGTSGNSNTSTTD